MKKLINDNEMKILYVSDDIPEEVGIRELKKFTDELKIILNNENMRILLYDYSTIIGTFDSNINFDDYNLIIFLFKDSETETWQQILDDFARYYCVNGSEKYDAKRIEKTQALVYKKWPWNGTQEEIWGTKGISDFLENSTEAFAIPYMSIDSVKLGILTMVCGIARRSSRKVDIDCHDEAVWLNDVLCIQTIALPEFVINHRLRAYKYKILNCEYDDESEIEFFRAKKMIRRKICLVILKCFMTLLLIGM